MIEVFYGMIPLILIVVGAWMRKSMLLKDIVQRLGNIEASLKEEPR